MREIIHCVYVVKTEIVWYLFNKLHFLLVLQKCSDRLIQDYTLKPLRLHVIVIHLWNIIEMYFVNNLIQYLSQWCYMVMFNIASRIELFSESRALIQYKDVILPE